MNPSSERASAKFKDVMQRFSTVREIGRGAFSSVYEGQRKTDPSQKVAMKQLHIASDAARRQAGSGSASNQQARPKRQQLGADPSLLWELECLDLHHPNIIHVEHVTLRVPPSILIYLSYMDCDLRRLISTGLHRTQGLNLDLPSICPIATQILSGIAYLHCNGILHRDLKPQNIMVSVSPPQDGPPSFHVKLIDFGWARHYAQPLIPMLTEGTPGTPFYRAPEVLTAKHDYGPPFDMWSVGCVIFELIASSCLFQYKMPENPDKRGPFKGFAVALEQAVARLGHPGEFFPPPGHDVGMFRRHFPPPGEPSASPPPPAAGGGPDGDGGGGGTPQPEAYDPQTAPATLRRLATTLSGRSGVRVHPSCLESPPLWEALAATLHWSPALRLTAPEALQKLSAVVGTGCEDPGNAGGPPPKRLLPEDAQQGGSKKKRARQS